MAVVAGDSVQSLDRFCVKFCWSRMRLASFAFHVAALNSSSAPTLRAPPPTSSCRRLSSPTATIVSLAGICRSCGAVLAFESSCLVYGSSWNCFQSFCLFRCFPPARCTCICSFFCSERLLIFFPFHSTLCNRYGLTREQLAMVSPLPTLPSTTSKL